MHPLLIVSGADQEAAAPASILPAGSFFLSFCLPNLVLTSLLSLEFSAARNKKFIPVTIFYPENESLSLDLDPLSVGSEICLQLGNHLKLTSTSGFNISVNGGLLGEKEFLMDFLHKIEESGENLSTVDFSFQKQYYMPDEPRSTTQTNFVYQQVYFFHEYRFDNILTFILILILTPLIRFAIFIVKNCAPLMKTLPFHLLS